MTRIPTSMIEEAEAIAHIDFTQCKSLYPSGPPLDSHHPGDDLGRLVLDAYRKFDGAPAAKEVLAAFLERWNQLATEAGYPLTTWDRLKGGIAWALPGATEHTLAKIRSAMH